MLKIDFFLLKIVKKRSFLKNIVLYISDIELYKFLKFICSTQGGVVYQRIKADLCRHVF